MKFIKCINYKGNLTDSQHEHLADGVFIFNITSRPDMDMEKMLFLEQKHFLEMDSNTSVSVKPFFLNNLDIKINSLMFNVAEYNDKFYPYACCFGDVDYERNLIGIWAKTVRFKVDFNNKEYFADIPIGCLYIKEYDATPKQFLRYRSVYEKK
jgi:hypothetical protein